MIFLFIFIVILYLLLFLLYRHVKYIEKQLYCSIRINTQFRDLVCDKTRKYDRYLKRTEGDKYDPEN